MRYAASPALLPATRGSSIADAGRQTSSTGRPAVAHPLDQSGQRSETGQRGELLGRAVAQHPEHRAQLGERRPAGLLDGGQRRARRSSGGTEPQPLGPGLHDHHGDRVRDDVVHLARDPVPLGLGALRGGGPRLDLQQRGTRRVVGGHVGATPYERAGGPRAGPQEPGPEVVGRALLGDDPRRTGQQGGRQAGRDRDPSPRRARRGVEGDEHGQDRQLWCERAGRDGAHREVGRGDDQCGHRRVGPSPGQRQRDQHAEREQRTVRRHLRVRHDLGDEQGEEDQRRSRRRGSSSRRAHARRATVRAPRSRPRAQSSGDATPGDLPCGLVRRADLCRTAECR